MKTNCIIFLAAFSFVLGASMCLADETKDHICFRVLDSNKDGVVTFAEFQIAYGNEKDKFDAADLDGDGQLTHDEYHELLGHGAS